LKRQLIELRDAYANLRNILPAWFSKTPDHFLSSTRFVVCGSVCRSEIRVLARHAQIVAIVDDLLYQKQPFIFGIPVISSDAWITMCRQDREIVSCFLTPGGRAFQHFTKLASQWDLPVLLPLQFIYLLEACKVDKQGETGRFFWYGYEFFLETLHNMDR